MIQSLKPYFILTAAALALYLPFLGAVHLFDWDEINFAESAREMLLSGEYFQVQINFMPFWEKPPLFIWMQALSMKIFGVNEFAARFPNALCGVLTLLTIYRLGKDHYSEKVAMYWVLAYAGSMTPQLYFKSGIIDPFFNLFIFLSIVMVAKAALLDPKPRKWLYFFGGIFLGLALLTKGPVAVIVVGLCILVVLILRSFHFFFDWKDVLLFSLSTLLISFAWYGVEFLRHGFWFFEEFIRYQKELASQSVASHGQPWYYHPLVLLVGAFPASIIALRAFGENLTWTQKEKNFRLWMAVLFWVVLILFSMVKTKIIHYSSLCYLPLTFLAALVMESSRIKRIQYRRSNAFLVGTVGTLIFAAFFLIPLLMGTSLKPSLLATIDDPFALANLRQDIIFPWFTYLPAAIMFITLLFSVRWLWMRELEKGFPMLFGGTLLALQVFLVLVVPRIELFTQGPAIAFIEKVQAEEAYIETLGYKSYAQYYYGKTMPIGDTASFKHFSDSTRHLYAGTASREIPNQQFKAWLLHGDIDKPAYFIAKYPIDENLIAHPNLEFLGQEGGFVFYRRKINEPGSSSRPE
ncbi:MAG TPA: glycosyl transferase [Bacteroidetes bacterium]|nr:glycosyl transferase [Bacteroidota bacterium]